jgi:putative ATP-dependent endonuclease of OLD family
VAAVATKASCTNAQVEKIVEKRLPSTFSEGFFCDTVVVVEGDTDKAVIETLAEKLGMSLDAEGISVLEMSGKGGLHIPCTMFEELRIPAYVLVDGDALGAARKHPNDATKRTQAHNAHETATNEIQTWLPGSATAQHGTLPYNFGDASIVSDRYTIWEDDIEEELSKWPSFMAALTTNGSRLRSKDLLAYRTAVLDASNSDLPAPLRNCIEAIVAFGS